MDPYPSPLLTSSLQVPICVRYAKEQRQETADLLQAVYQTAFQHPLNANRAAAAGVVEAIAAVLQHGSIPSITSFNGACPPWWARGNAE